jgi:predicted metal-dependent hydrolase
LNKKPKFSFGEIFIKNHRTLWGSCSDQGNINLNWRLIMAPRFVSDYILFHEMCHLKYLNHSRRYWSLVSDICPDYQKAENWIREYGFLLHINLFNWPTY